MKLHVWRVPAPPAGEREEILARALTPATSRKRSRMPMIFAALAISNIVLAAILVIVITQQPQKTIVTLQPAGGGGGGLDAQASEVLRRLDQHQRELESKLAEVQQLRTVVQELSDRVRTCEQSSKRDRSGPKPSRLVVEPIDPATCDEVSCTLTNFEGACCAKFARAAAAAVSGSAGSAKPAVLPDGLDRRAITAGIAAVRAQVTACAERSSAKGKVKARVVVSPAGRVASVAIEAAPDAVLGACVASVMKNATFEPTRLGGSFSYPFVF